MSAASMFYPIGSGQRYHINAKIMGSDKQMHNVTLLADTGNDITLLTLDTAKSLGFNPAQIGTAFSVAGITNQPSTFKKIWDVIDLGSMRPVWIRMGLAMNQGALAENLLGREDIIDNGRYEVTYSSSGVKYVERHTNINTGSGGETSPTATNLAHSLRSRISQAHQRHHYGFY